MIVKTTSFLLRTAPLALLFWLPSAQAQPAEGFLANSKVNLVSCTLPIR